jgi:hypothetical protein
MGFKNLVNKQVALAFKAIGDLAEDVILVRAKKLGEYDFSLMDAGPDSTQTVTVKGVLTQRKRKEGSQTREATLLLPSDDLHTWSDFDKARAGSVEWRVLSHTDNGYTVKLELSRSV